MRDNIEMNAQLRLTARLLGGGQEVEQYEVQSMRCGASIMLVAFLWFNSPKMLPFWTDLKHTESAPARQCCGWLGTSTRLPPATIDEPFI
jgi:hypothetical protein